MTGRKTTTRRSVIARRHYANIQAIPFHLWFAAPATCINYLKKAIVLARYGFRCILKKLNLKPKAASLFKITTDSQHNKSAEPNILVQLFSPPAANVAWAADIAFIRTDEGCLYLAAVIDVYSRRIVGWSMGNKLVTKLIIDALTMPLLQRKSPQRVIHHSNRGPNIAKLYTRPCSRNMFRLLNKRQVSENSRGNCYDNTVREKLLSYVKGELIYGHRYRTKKKTQTALFYYIKIFYNRQRLLSSFDYQFPESFERAT